MSNLLKEAIVDANALRDAALKNAEASVIDKYSDEVRTALSQILEQDELGGDLGADPLAGGDLGADPLAGGDLGGDPLAADPMEATGETDESLEEDVDEVPYAATDNANEMEGQNLKNIPGEGEPVEVTLDLGALRESINTLQAEIDEELTFDEGDLLNMLKEDDGEDNPSDAPAGGQFDVEEDEDDHPHSGGGALAASASDVAAVGKYGAATISEDEEDKEIEITDELIDEIVERLTVDMGATLSGWAGRSSESVKWQLKKALAQRRSTDVQDELDIMRKAQEELVFENKQLTERLSQYKQVTGELKETLQTVNLSNARLLYTNRVLRNTSLNERQKNRIAEAISKSDSVTEAKTIFNTLQSTVQSAPTRGPQSLSEAINRPSSVIRATRKEKAQPTDVFAERMRQLAGIK